MTTSKNPVGNACGHSLGVGELVHLSLKLRNATVLVIEFLISGYFVVCLVICSNFDFLEFQIGFPREGLLINNKVATFVRIFTCPVQE